MLNNMKIVIVLILSVSLWGNALFADEVLLPEGKYNWNDVLNAPPGTKYTDGNQILHFKSKNKHFTSNNKARAFVETYLIDATVAPSDAEVLKFASDSVTVEGEYLELGVCTGKTINFLAALNPHKSVHGFDSFEGLPVPWVRDDRTIEAGAFAFKKSGFTPPVLHNVKLYKGLFSKTLPRFKKQYLGDKPIALLHVDCDIYESTKEAFDALGGNLVPGSVLVFDELYNYPGSERHEWKALNEFLEKSKLKAEYLAYNPFHEQVALRLKSA